MLPNNTETYKEKIEHFKKLSGFTQEDSEHFIKLVYKYLDSCGYFIQDYDIHNLQGQYNIQKYYLRDFGKWLIDMALQYNMEQGIEYKCELVNKN